MPESDIKRRDFLKLGSQTILAASGLLGLGGLLRYLSYQGQAEAPRQINLGPAADYPPGTRKLVADRQALLVHDEQGLRAISLVCTHLGCVVQEDGDGFTCPCHGSMYAPDGTLVRGPATQPLTMLPLEESENGDLILTKE